MISVGIDIGSYSIKVAEVEATSKSYVVRRVMEFPLSLDLTKDKKIEIIDTLRTLFGQYDLDQTQFIFSLAMKHVSARLLNLPFRERFKVQRAIISQLEDELPFSQEDAIFDAKIVRFAGKGAEILAMAAPIERVRDVVDLARDCGVEPLFISTEASGVNNLFERWAEAPPEGLAPEQEIPTARQAEMVLNIGHLSSEVLVYADGILLAMRNIDWGAKNIADAIGAKYNLNHLQAMRELQAKGFVLIDKTGGTKDQIVFSQTIEAALAHFTNELRLVMLELQSEMNLQWSKGHMIGGGSQLKNFGAFLTQNFEIPFNRFKQFEAHPAVTADTSANLELVSVAAVGLALEGLRRPRNPATNFLKGVFAQQSQFLETLWEKWGHAAQLAGIAFVVMIAYGLIRESLATSLLDESDKVMRAQAESIAGIKSKQANPARINKFISNQEKLERSRKSAEKVVRLNSAMDILNRISAVLPSGPAAALEIKRVSISNDTAEVQGYADNENQHAAVRKALQKAASDGKLDSAQMMIRPPAGKVGFAYRFRVDRYTGG